MSKFFEMMKQGHGYGESWVGEHWGHDDPPHPSGGLSNGVSRGGANSTVYYENTLAATKNTNTSSGCSCCDFEGLPSSGTFKTYSGTVFIHGENAVASCDSAYDYDHRGICKTSKHGTVYIGS